MKPEKGFKHKPGYCWFHKKRLSAKEIRLHRCIENRCQRFEAYPDHPWWRKKVRGFALALLEPGYFRVEDIGKWAPGEIARIAGYDERGVPVLEWSAREGLGEAAHNG